jgi:NAD(P)-dependent dehydrogenase (short-subunit alcohol dehydrogenase family)
MDASAVALVTGAGFGIGRASRGVCARGLSRDGRGGRRDVRAPDRGRARWLGGADSSWPPTSRAGQCQAVVDATVARFGRVDVL